MTQLSNIELYYTAAGPTPVVTGDFAHLCARPYHGHPHGCPNVGRNPLCPPYRKHYNEQYTPQAIVIAIGLDWQPYLEMRRKEHPAWTDRQLANPLYWQGFLTAKLRDFVQIRLASLNRVMALSSQYEAIYIPEAAQVNVSDTCAKVGIHLEWPPKTRVYKVALLAVPKPEVANDHSIRF